jgi:large subunit ribosomal protein L25
MVSIDLSATVRTETGKGAARKIRHEGLVPATVYRGGEEATLLKIDPRLLQLGFERTGNPNTLVNLNFDDTTKVCLVKEVQRHPVSGVIRHVDFYNVTSDQKITVNVPIQAVGKAKGVALGGKLRVIRRTLTVSCKAADIPDSIDVDVTNVDVGEFLKASELPKIDNCELIFLSDFNVATVIRRRGTT